MDKISFDSGQYILRREDGHAGDSGGMLISIDPSTLLPVGSNGDVIVGCRIKCGSLYARSYQSQDWWMTSVVKEIKQLADGVALITTRNNRYYVGNAKDIASFIEVKIIPIRIDK